MPFSPSEFFETRLSGLLEHKGVKMKLLLKFNEGKSLSKENNVLISKCKRGKKSLGALIKVIWA